MFTLARADAGSYPVRRTPMYLDEVVEDGVRAARVLADKKQVSIESATIDSASFTGDEELVRRLVSNLLDNAVRHARERSVVHVNLSSMTARVLLILPFLLACAYVFYLLFERPFLHQPRRTT